MIIGLVPGAMKPYHAGHHYLVMKAIHECDHVVIFTTTKDRKGISGLNMLKAWDELIIPKIMAEVKFVKSPIRSIYELLEIPEATEGNEFRVYSGTEDWGRFNSSSLERYCSGVNVCNVAEKDKERYRRGTGESPMAKGEWIRKSIEDNDFQVFRDYLPAFLKPHAERYLSILVG